MKVEEMKLAFVMKYRLIAFDKDGKRRCNEEDMLIGIDEICEAVIAEKSPSNEQIHGAALVWAKEHSEAPDKDCPAWLIRDYEAGAYFVRQCMGCWNKPEPDKSEVDKMVDEQGGMKYWDEFNKQYQGNCIGKTLTQILESFWYYCNGQKTKAKKLMS